MSMTYGQGPRDRDDPARLQKVCGWVDEDGVFTPDKGRTKQEFKKECDINNIVATIAKTGTIDWLERHEEWLKQAADQRVENIDYRTLMTTVAQASEKFSELPSDVRQGFHNDTAEFLDFVQSEGGNIELAELIDKAKKPAERAGSVMKAAEKTGAAPVVEKTQPTPEGVKESKAPAPSGE